MRAPQGLPLVSVKGGSMTCSFGRQRPQVAGARFQKFLPESPWTEHWFIQRIFPVKFASKERLVLSPRDVERDRGNWENRCQGKLVSVHFNWQRKKGDS